MAGEPIPFFTDNCVPDSVGDAIVEDGHRLTRLRDVMPGDTADPVIAFACAKGGEVLVSLDSDFRAGAKRLQVTQREYQRRLHRVYLNCLAPIAATRIREAISLIEQEWLLATDERPLSIEIRDKSIKTNR